MEASETPPESVDLGGEEAEETDPFADVPAEPIPTEEETALPEGVEEGSLGGDNPSDVPPEEPVPAEETEVPGATEPEVEVQEPEPEPEIEIEEPEPEAEHEVPAEPETPVEETEEPDSTPPLPDAAEGNEQEEPDQPEAKPKPKPKRKRGKGKGKSKAKSGGGNEERGYVIVVGNGKGMWTEAFPSEEVGKPFILKARNGTIALRRAYRKLTEEDDSPGDYTLVAMPEVYFRPKKVAGRVHRQTAISID